MDKVNLDELFREKFKAFREIPDPKVWAAIENSLDGKRKNRVIPLWWKLGGVAAVLAIALIALYPSDDTLGENPKITDTEKTEGSALDPKNSGPDKKDIQKDYTPAPATTDDAVVDGVENRETINTEQYTNSDHIKSSVSDKNSISKAKDANAVSPITKTNKDSDNQYPEKTQLAANEPDIDSNDGERGDKTEEYSPILIKESPDVKQKSDTEALASSGADTSKKTDTPKTDTRKKNQDGIAGTEEEPGIISSQGKEKAAQNEIAAEDTDKAADNKKSIFEALEEQADDEKLAAESGSRWSAGPSIAPVYFNAIGEGSPIDPGFSSNSKSGSTNLSYGFSVAYAVNDKLSLRSGIHKAEYGYNTNHVGFSPTLAASSSGRLQNIDYAGGSENLAVNDAVSNSGSPDAEAPEFSALNSTRDGTVAQSFGYLEIPLELDYALIDRRFGVNVVGGISSLFLLDNSVALNSGELSTQIGEASNLNDLNFSTNIGFGVNYKFTPMIQLNIEPVFKYQLNTFSNTSGDFRPYSIGVYSGLNFKF